MNLVARRHVTSSTPNLENFFVVPSSAVWFGIVGAPTQTDLIKVSFELGGTADATKYVEISNSRSLDFDAAPNTEESGKIYFACPVASRTIEFLIET